MNKAILTVGIPASGKSTFAKEHCRKTGALNINRDDIRFTLFGYTDWSNYRCNKINERTVTDIQQSMARTAVLLGKDIVISDTNLSKKTRTFWENFFKQYGYTVEYKVFDVPLLEAYKRDSLRQNGVGQQVIYTMYQKYLEYTGRRTYQPNKKLPEAVIVDVDGTVADMTGVRGPFEWDKVGQDAPRHEIIDMVSGLRARGMKIIFLSGRDGVCEDRTRKWLETNVGSFDAFFIRNAGDQRKDTVIKEEIFWANVAPYYNVTTAIDDRPCIVRLWYELGIKNVVSVGNPYLEF